MNICRKEGKKMDKKLFDMVEEVLEEAINKAFLKGQEELGIEDGGVTPAEGWEIQDTEGMMRDVILKVLKAQSERKVTE